MTPPFGTTGRGPAPGVGAAAAPGATAPGAGAMTGAAGTADGPRNVMRPKRSVAWKFPPRGALQPAKRTPPCFGLSIKKKFTRHESPTFGGVCAAPALIAVKGI